MSDVTVILEHAQQGEPHAGEELLLLVSDVDPPAIDQALDQWAGFDPTAAELVKLRFFVGVAHAEAVRMIGLSRNSADRVWVFARAWLDRQLRGDETRTDVEDGGRAPTADAPRFGAGPESRESATGRRLKQEARTWRIGNRLQALPPRPAPRA